MAIETPPYRGSAHGNVFPNPYYDIANTYVPRDIKRTFAWCESLYLSGGILKAATDRIIQYFITEIQYKSQTENTEKLKEILEKKFKIKTVLSDVGRDFMVYGNSINSIYFPFNRMFKCPKCGLEINSKKIKYDYRDGDFYGNCPCGKKDVKFTAYDMKDKNPELIKLSRLDPKSIDIKRHPLAGVCEHYWDMPNHFISHIKNEKDIFYVNYTQTEILDAIKKEESFKFNQDYVYHIKANTLAGFPLEWGCPIFLHILKLNFYNAVLRRANEAIALDFIIPFRVISPGTSSPNFDPVAQTNLGDFVSRMNMMCQRHKIDPADIQIAPFPINYQAFGAEKKALDVTAEIKSVTEEMLHSLNYPAELFFNSLKIQSFPPALRLFENTWSELVSGFNGILQWIVDHICDFMRWEREEVELTQVTIADDIEKRQVLLQLASAQQISLITGLKAYGLDFKEEQRKIADQQKILMDIQKDIQEEMQTEQMLSEGEGQPAMPDLETQSVQLAQRWLSIPEELRTREMRNMEAMNRTLYAMAKDKMDKIRSTARTDQGYQNLAAAGMTGHMQPPPQ